MNRYQTIDIIQDTNGKRIISTCILSAPILNELDIYIQTTSIERLDLLAKQFYDDVTYWWALAAANGYGKGSLYVPSGVQLRIPSKNNIVSYIETLNASR